MARVKWGGGLILVSVAAMAAGLPARAEGLGDAAAPSGPSIAYATYLDVQGEGIAVDASGNAYVTGSTSPDRTLVKLSPTGTIVYATELVAPGRAVAVDATGNAYVTGTTQPLNGRPDAFVAKVTPTGTLAFTSLVGGSGDDSGDGISVDGAGDAYVTGSTGSVDFPVTAGLDTALDGASDAYVARITPSGVVAYATYLGGGNDEKGARGLSGGIAVDSAGYASVTGTTSSTDFPATPGLDTTLGGTKDVFVARLTPAGALDYATYLGGSADDLGSGIAVDRGRAYVTGLTASVDYPTTAGLDQDFAGAGDGFVAKLTKGGAVSYATYLGDVDTGWGIAVDGTGHAYVTGIVSSPLFPATPGLDTTFDGSSDGFVARLTPTGTIGWATYLGGGRDDYGYGIAVDGAGAAYVSGFTSSGDFPTTAGLDTDLGGLDGFATKLAVVAGPSVSVSNAAVTEGDGPSQPQMSFTVTLAQPSSSAILVRVHTARIGNGAAEATPGKSPKPGVDFKSHGTELLFRPGQTTKTFPVRVFGDAVIEPDESFRVVARAGLPTTTAVGTIVNDD